MLVKGGTSNFENVTTSKIRNVRNN